MLRGMWLQRLGVPELSCGRCLEIGKDVFRDLARSRAETLASKRSQSSSYSLADMRCSWRQVFLRFARALPGLALRVKGAERGRSSKWCPAEALEQGALTSELHAMLSPNSADGMQYGGS